MATFFENKDRRVIPNWRSFNKTVMLGELDVPSISIPKVDVSLNIDSYIEDFKENRTIAHAGDLISAAIVNGVEKNVNVIDAAKFILANSKTSTKSQKSLSERIVSGNSGTKNNLFKLESITIDEFDSCVNPKHNWGKIHQLKEIATQFQFNPIIWVELSRQYSIIGQQKQAINAMKIAMQLAPENRFILRSAVRLFAHYDDLELSHDIVRKCKFTNVDPWLTSAEISLATLRGRTSRFMKIGAEMVSSKNLSPFSFTELASSLGTVEIINGNKKKSRDLFHKALLSPNDNSLAQIEWASKIDAQLDINQSNFQVKHNFEAMALENFNNMKLDDALNSTFHWFLDMPFSKRPVMLGSHISALLNDKERARDFLKAGLVSHPYDPQLLNNLGYSFALENKTEEALDYINKAGSISSMDISTKICLTATRGLISFRTGLPDLGRKLYLDAIQQAKDIKSEYFNWLAILNYVREELLIKSEFVDSLMETVAIIPEDAKDIDIKKLKKEVVELYQKNKSQGT
jgi:tetratricopeptide (TPR) repeat protein